MQVSLSMSDYMEAMSASKRVDLLPQPESCGSRPSRRLSTANTHKLGNLSSRRTEVADENKIVPFFFTWNEGNHIRQSRTPGFSARFFVGAMAALTKNNLEGHTVGTHSFAIFGYQLLEFANVYSRLRRVDAPCQRAWCLPTRASEAAPPARIAGPPNRRPRT